MRAWISHEAASADGTPTGNVQFLVHLVQVEAVFTDGSRLVTVHAPIK